MKADTILAVLAAALLSLAACGGDQAEEKLEEASRNLAKAREAVEEARLEVEERQADAQAAQEELAVAREALREAEEECDDGALEDVAIVARVDKGVVSLSGAVPEAELRDRAVEIARSTPGVTSVESRIQVAKPE